MLTPYALRARAVCKIRHEVAYDFDQSRGIWLRRLESEEEIGNLVTDDGRVSLHTYIYGTTAQRISAGLGTGLNYIGLSDDGTAPAAGDTTLTGELSGNGLTRAQGVVTLPTGAGTLTTVAKQFIYTGVPAQDVQKTAIFDASVGGKMAHEILFTLRTLNTNDAITIEFSITLT